MSRTNIFFKCACNQKFCYSECKEDDLQFFGDEFPYFGIRYKEMLYIKIKYNIYSKK